MAGPQGPAGGQHFVSLWPQMEVAEDSALRFQRFRARDVPSVDIPLSVLGLELGLPGSAFLLPQRTFLAPLREVSWPRPCGLTSIALMPYCVDSCSFVIQFKVGKHDGSGSLGACGFI